MINLIDGIRPERASVLRELRGRHGLIHVKDDGRIRWLEVDGCIQSAWYKTDGAKPCLPHTKLMNLAAVFKPKPHSILMAGLGGGDLLRQFFSLNMGESVTVIEDCDHIVEVFEQYFCSKTLEPFELLIEDINDFMTNCQNKFDLMVLDIFVGANQPSWMLDRAFYLSCRRNLSDDAALMINVSVQSQDSFLAYVLMLREVFSKKVLFVPVPECENVIIFAFQGDAQFGSDEVFFQAVKRFNMKNTYPINLKEDEMLSLNVPGKKGLAVWES